MIYKNFKVYVPPVHRLMETGYVFYFSQECAAKHFAARTKGIVTPIDQYNSYMWTPISRATRNGG